MVRRSLEHTRRLQHQCNLGYVELAAACSCLQLLAGCLKELALRCTSAHRQSGRRLHQLCSQRQQWSGGNSRIDSTCSIGGLVWPLLSSPSKGVKLSAIPGQCLPANTMKLHATVPRARMCRAHTVSLAACKQHEMQNTDPPPLQTRFMLGVTSLLWLYLAAKQMKPYVTMPRAKICSANPVRQPAKQGGTPAQTLLSCLCFHAGRLPERIRPAILAFGGVADGFIPFEAKDSSGHEVQLKLASVVMKAVQVMQPYLGV